MNDNQIVMKCLQTLILVLVGTLLLSVGVRTQGDSLSNSQIIAMTNVGLDVAIILKKIDESVATFDISTDALIELRKNGVDNAVIARMIEKKTAAAPVVDEKNGTVNYSENNPAEVAPTNPAVVSPAEALRNAKTVAIEKSSLNPSRQSLEKSLMKRTAWQKHKLTLIRYKQEADIYIEIGRVPLSWVTHRYVFRIYDRRTGTIITAGETTSWGSLAENLAREITQKLDSVVK